MLVLFGTMTKILPKHFQQGQFETLFIIDFLENGSVPESLLEKVLDASSTMNELPLNVSPNNFFRLQ